MRGKRICLVAAFLAVAMTLTGTMAAWAAGRPSISRKKANMTVGEELQLTVADSSGEIKWKSSKKGVATVTSDGWVKARKKGKTVITARTGKKTLKCRIKVSEVKPAKVYLDALSITMQKGAKYKLKATVLPANTDRKKLKWKSSNKKVAIVSKSGVIRAKRAGKTKITVMTADGGKKDTCLVRVTKGKEGKVEITYSPEAVRQMDSEQDKDSGDSIMNRGTPAENSGSTPSASMDQSGQDIVVRTPVMIDLKPDTPSYDPSGSDKNEQETTHTVTAVSLKVICSVSFYAEGARPSQDDFEVYTVYSDGARKDCGSYSMKARSSSDKWTCTFTSGTLTTTVYIPIAVSVKTIDHITAACSISEADPDYEFQVSDITVTEHYTDGTSALAQAYSIRVESGGGKHVITVTDQGYTASITVPFTNTASGSGDSNQQGGYRLTVSMSPTTVNTGEMITDGQLTVKAQDLSTGENHIITDYECDFVPRDVAGDYTFHITWNGLTVAAKVTVVDPAMQYSSFTIRYSGAHGNYLVIEDGFSKEDLVITASMKDGTTKTLSADDYEIKEADLAGSDGEDTTIRIILPTGNLRVFSVVSYHRNSLTGKTELSRQKLSSDGEYHVKAGEDFDPSGKIIFRAQTYGGDMIEPEYQLDFTPKYEAGTYKTHLICRGKIYYTFNIIVD